jgi:hypothetical protein
MKFHEDIVRRKLKVPPEWQWYKVERIDPDATLMEGGVPRLLTRGPRKGKPTWKGCKLERCIVTDVEVAAEQKSYEATTGSCHRCLGTGEVLHGWSKYEGSKYRPCPRCKGTKVAPNAESPTQLVY